MESYNLTIERNEEYDVVVCGGGCAGVAAAISAARNGAKTLLLEKQQLIGGTATAAMVNPFMISFDGEGKRQIVKGIFEEIVRRLEAFGGAVHPSKVPDGSPFACYYSGNEHRHNNVTPFDAELLQLVLLDMLKEAGVVLLINFTVLDKVMEDGAICGVIGFDGSDVRRYNAHIVIDCTGDALIAYKAGAVMPECLDTSAEVQPMTTFFSVYGVDDQAIESYIAQHPEERGMMFRSYIEKEMEKGGYPIPRNKIGLMKGLRPGEWNMNCTRIQGKNALIPEDLTDAYDMAIHQIFFLMDFLGDKPGCADIKLKSIAPMVGVRETRRIDGEYTLEMEDLVEPPKGFDDSIAMGSYPFDLHPSKGIRAGLEGRPPVANCFQIPYRILVPRVVDGLLVAGRCVSASRDAMASIRVMPQAYAMGQAAGTAAAICAIEGIQPRKLDVKKLQRQLEADGAVIE